MTDTALPLDIAPLDVTGTPASTHRSDALTREALVAITVLTVSLFTVILNEMLMAVALPRVMADLAVTASTAQWLTTGYMLTMAVVIPTTGFLTQRFQMRTVFTIAMALFVMGTAVCILAPGFEALLVGRIVQAVGTAIVMPLGFTAVSTLAPASHVGRMMALMTIAGSVAPALGPLVSGLILSVASWHWLFITILPIAVVCLVVGNAMIRVPSTPRQVGIDVLSVGLSAVGFASLVYGLALLGEGGDGHAVVSPWTAVGLGVAVIVLFVARQLHLQKSDRALLDLRPFSVRTFRSIALTMTLFMTAATGVMTLVPVVLQTSYGLSTLQAGLFMAPGGLTIAAITAVVGRLYDRMGPRPLIVVGVVVDAVGLWVLASLAPGASIWLVLAAYLTVIVGQALIWTPLFAGSLGALSETLSSHGSAIVNTIQQLAGAAGIAIAFAVLTAASSTHAAGGQSAGEAMAHGAQQAYLVSLGIMLVALVTAFFIPKQTASASRPVAMH